MRGACCKSAGCSLHAEMCTGAKNDSFSRYVAVRPLAAYIIPTRPLLNFIIRTAVPAGNRFIPPSPTPGPLTYTHAEGGDLIKDLAHIPDVNSCCVLDSQPLAMAKPMKNKGTFGGCISYISPPSNPGNEAKYK